MTIKWEAPCGCELLTTKDQMELVHWKKRCLLHGATEFKEMKRQIIEANLYAMDATEEQKQNLREAQYQFHGIEHGV